MCGVTAGCNVIYHMNRYLFVTSRTTRTSLAPLIVPTPAGQTKVTAGQLRALSEESLTVAQLRNTKVTTGQTEVIVRPCFSVCLAGTVSNNGRSRIHVA